MEHVSLNIDHLGMGKAPETWTLAHRIKMQRLYYIIGGTGYYKNENAEYVKMEQGKIYIFPYNFYAEFKCDKNDPIDHIYFDFISTPPIVSNGPIMYDVPENSDICCMINYIKSIFGKFELPKMTESKISHITSAEGGTFDEERQIVYYSLYQLLILLSNYKKIPFLNDDVVSDSVNYIRKNIDKDLSVSVLAGRMNFETHYFIRRFKEVMNETPHLYIKKYRVLRARELLSEGLSYEEAAHKVGYKNGKSLWNAVNSKEK